MKKLFCLFCPRNFNTLDDLRHHLESEHIGISSDILQEATLARETKKQLGNFLKQHSNLTGFECALCFEVFSSIEKLCEHGLIEHDRIIDPQFIEKLKKLKEDVKKKPPLCDNCHHEFLGLVTTRMDKKLKTVCFNCYEKHYGKNALRRLTIGTPDEMIDKMRKKLK